MHASQVCCLRTELILIWSAAFADLQLESRDVASAVDTLCSTSAKRLAKRHMLALAHPSDLAQALCAVRALRRDSIATAELQAEMDSALCRAIAGAHADMCQTAVFAHSDNIVVNRHADVYDLAIGVVDALFELQRCKSPPSPTLLLAVQPLLATAASLAAAHAEQRGASDSAQAAAHAVLDAAALLPRPVGVDNARAALDMLRGGGSEAAVEL